MLQETGPGGRRACPEPPPGTRMRGPQEAVLHARPARPGNPRRLVAAAPDVLGGLALLAGPLRGRAPGEGYPGGPPSRRHGAGPRRRHGRVHAARPQGRPYADPLPPIGRGARSRAALGGAPRPRRLPARDDVLRLRRRAGHVRDDGADPLSARGPRPRAGIGALREGVRRGDGGAAAPRRGPAVPRRTPEAPRLLLPDEQEAGGREELVCGPARGAGADDEAPRGC